MKIWLVPSILTENWDHFWQFLPEGGTHVWQYDENQEFLKMINF